MRMMQREQVDDNCKSAILHCFIYFNKFNLVLHYLDI